MTPVPPPTPAPAPAAKTFPWDIAFQVLGVAAGLAAWIALVGGAKLWARFNTANIEATQTLAGLPRELLVEEGLITLLVPILLGTAAAVIVLAWPDNWPKSVEEAQVLAAIAALALFLVALAIAEVHPWLFLAVIGTATVLGLIVGWPVVRGKADPARLNAAALTFLLTTAIGTGLVFYDALEPHAWLAMLGITILAIALTWVVLRRATRRWHVALTLFVALALWAGALGYAQEAGDRTPRLVRAEVFLKAGGDPMGGYLLGHASQRLYLAQNTRGEQIEDDPIRHVVVLPDDAIAKVTYRTEDILPEARDDEKVGDDQTGTGPPPPGGDGTPTPTPTPTSSPESGSGPGQGAADPETESLPLPAPGPRSAGSIDGVRVEFQVLDATRQGNMIQLNAQLVNVSNVRGAPATLDIGDALDDRDPENDSNTADGLELFDVEARDLFPVDHHSNGRCSCTDRLDLNSLEPGEITRIWASFPIGESRPAEVDLTVPGFGWIRGVAVR